MSFGFSASDVVLLVQSAWTTVQNSRKACGEYAELTREMTSLHVNLRRLERETAKPESPINRPSDTCRQDLVPIVDGCRKALDVLDRILEKYNTLSDEERSKGKLWKAVRFGNGELTNVKDLRLKLTYYTSNLSLFLNMVSMGSMGMVEKQMYEAGGDLKDIRRAVNGITAQLMSGSNKEGSVLTDYADDDKAVWKAFRRELVKEGFLSNVIREHKEIIQAYVKELGSRGILDDEDSKNSGDVSEKIEDTAPSQATPQSRDEAMGSRKASFTRRTSLGPQTTEERRVSGSGDDKSMSSDTSAAEDSNLAHRYPPVEIEVMQRDQGSNISELSSLDQEDQAREERYIQVDPSEIPSMPPDIMLEGKIEAAIPLLRKNQALRETGSSSRTGMTGHAEGFSGNVNRDAREDQTFSQQRQTAPPPLTMNHISDTLFSTTQADAEIDSDVESGSREFKQVDDRTNRHRSSAPIPLAQSVAEIREQDTWLLRGKTYELYTYNYDYDIGIFLASTWGQHNFDILSNPLIAQGEILEFQGETKGFLKVAEIRIRLRQRKCLLQLSPLFFRNYSDRSIFSSSGYPNKIIISLLRFGLRHIDARPEKWRITKWPSPREKTKSEEHEDGDKSKRRAVATHATPAVVEDTQDPSSTTEDSETEGDEEDQRTKDKAWAEAEHRYWHPPRFPRHVLPAGHTSP